MTPDTISLVMPVRNGAEHLPATLQSVRKLVDLLEVIVVDDGSTDDTPALLAAAQQRDPRLQVIRQGAAGIVSALNRGLQAARGQWILRLDADDVAHPLRARRSLAYAHTHQLDVVATGVRCFPTQRIRAGLKRYERWQNGLITPEAISLARFVESPIVHPSVLMRRVTVLAAGAYRDLGWSEDYDLWLRLLHRGIRFGKVPDLLTFWRDHAARLTRTAANCSADAFAACKAAHLLAGPLAGGRPYWIAGTGPDGKRLAKALSAAGGRLSGWLDINPRRLGQTIYGARVHTLAEAPLAADAVVLGCVGGAGGRERVTRLMQAAGLRPGETFWAAA